MPPVEVMVRPYVVILIPCAEVPSRLPEPAGPAHRHLECLQSRPLHFNVLISMIASSPPASLSTQLWCHLLSSLGPFASPSHPFSAHLYIPLLRPLTPVLAPQTDDNLVHNFCYPTNIETATTTTTIEPRSSRPRSIRFSDIGV
ncbi:hypothetical protein E4U43_004484 [Claviceps pusilla]|uniref:Uncharacterized protein n=1 Tax=Claviceps pusilla TaxID=123648 RepID=A0A9P7N467_9HYPO|nr:hypothetical protein E4U43_004484 [Claviceps pusilla]